MDITIDTSALIAVIGDELQKEKIVKATRNASLLAPFSVNWEIGNAFSAMLKRNRITFIEAKACIEAYKKIPIKFVEVGLVETLQLVDHLKIYAYDAYLIKCAQERNTPLLTLDNGLIEAAKSMGIKIVEI